QALQARTNVLYEWEKWDQALRDAHRALAVCQEIRDSAGEAWAHSNLARIYRVLHRPYDGLEHGRRAVDLGRAIGDLHAEGRGARRRAAGGAPPPQLRPAVHRPRRPGTGPGAPDRRAAAAHRDRPPERPGRRPYLHRQRPPAPRPAARRARRPGTGPDAGPP